MDDLALREVSWNLVLWISELPLPSCSTQAQTHASVAPTFKLSWQRVSGPGLTLLLSSLVTIHDGKGLTAAHLWETRGNIREIAPYRSSSKFTQKEKRERPGSFILMVFKYL